MKRRKKLSKLNGERMTFRAKFGRYGEKPGYWGGTERTILLRQIQQVETGEVVTDHAWLSVGKQLADLGELGPGDVLEFDARVAPYEKGYRGRNITAQIDSPARSDFKLRNPTRLRIVQRGEED